MLRPTDAAKHLGVSSSTLRRWDKEGRIASIRTHGNHRRYDESDLLQQPAAGRKSYAYCRVSSLQQKADLERQKQAMQEAYPHHEIISDIGSGLNFKRKGLLRMVDEIVRGDVEEVVVSHRDRLCRFAFELIEYLCNQNSTKLVVKNQEISSAEQELSEDLMAIVHVFSCRHHGMRRYTNRKVSENSAATNSQSSEDFAKMDESSSRYIQHGSSTRKRQKGQTQQSSEETGCHIKS